MPFRLLEFHLTNVSVVAQLCPVIVLHVDIVLSRPFCYILLKPPRLPVESASVVKHLKTMFKCL